MVNMYKWKSDALECGSLRGIKVLDQVMKILERVLEVRVRNVVKVDPMQYGFSPGKGTTDAVFTVRQMQERLLSKRKDLWMVFVDLERALTECPVKCYGGR
jgi:Reverse transcriptase (RNA-dependent DNA polymerase)